MKKSLFVLSLAALLTFVACEKKKEEKKEGGVTVEAAKEATLAKDAAHATMPAPATAAPAHDAHAKDVKDASAKDAKDASTPAK
ncbi:MAG: hypothetical protein NT128_06030 [Proteobacteria bacterium]|nr:hypothetical protein [Pseudomonadota bacterium]